jgi:seryl-tRNA synthetase
MLDLRDLRKNTDFYIAALEKRGKKYGTLVQHFLVQLEKQTGARQKLENLRAEQNALTKTIPQLQGAERTKTLQSLKQLSAAVAKEETTVRNLETFERDQEVILPNVPLPDVPVGLDASGNVVIREIGRRNNFTDVKDYLTLGEHLDIIDMQRAAKVSGSRFGYLKGAGALLEFALVQYAMQELTKAKFTAIVPPVLINEPYMEAMGYLAQGGSDEVYHLEKDKQYLVGTSEQSVGPFHADEVLAEAELPKRYAAFSSCFRREAGSYGRDTKGILRVHQFDKLEMFVVCAPHQSEAIHQELLTLQERLVQGLQLPYRVVQLCTGDIGFPSAKTYDIECWLPGQNAGKGEYRETHSTSNTTDYQARALNIRIKGKDGKNVFAHMLNGTAFAIGRTIIAILENYQQADGSVLVPDVLQPFMHGIKVIQKP